MRYLIFSRGEYSDCFQDVTSFAQVDLSNCSTLDIKAL